MLTYKLNQNCSLDDTTRDAIYNTVNGWNKLMVDEYAKISKFHPWNHIPVRNQSGGIAESFASYMCATNETLVENPCGDGYPDILPNIPEAQPWIDNPTTENYLGPGGFDVKALLAREKIDTNASAHHRQTTKVLNVIWNFFDNIPQVIGVTYTNSLVEDDWGVPSSGSVGSKTTPSCSLRSSGKKKLREGWVILKEDIVLVSPEHWVGFKNT